MLYYYDIYTVFVIIGHYGNSETQVTCPIFDGYMSPLKIEIC